MFRIAPSSFKDEPSLLSRLAAYSALALFLMVADARFGITTPVRQLVATAIFPLQWAMLQPVTGATNVSKYFESHQKALREADEASQKMVEMTVRANQGEQLQLENARLRKLLDLRERIQTAAQSAEVLYDTADPYTRRVIIDQGTVAGIELGSPVMDESGVMGQVTRVFPLNSEVTLLIDRDQAIPVLNARTGERSVAYGDPVMAHGGGMELRFMPANADVKEGDLLTTSGVDGLYPTGLDVAQVIKVEHRADSPFARIYCKPLSNGLSARHVMVLKPLNKNWPDLSEELKAEAAKKGAKK